MRLRQRRSLLRHVCLIIGIGLSFAGSAMAQSEEPAYTVFARDGDVEVRDYAPVIVAEVVIEGERDSAVNAGFRVLAGYIFGDNISRTKIAMTAPVTQSRGETIDMTAPVTETAQGSGWVIRFMMPRASTMNTLPKPADERITLKQIPGRRVAVLRFSGLWTEGNLNAHREDLAAVVAKKSWKPKGNAIFAFYDPPWKPFFWRRNEVMQEIDPR